MKIGLIGTGKMGTAVLSALQGSPHTVEKQFNSKNPPTVEALAACDVVIDFSVAAAVREHVHRALAASCPLVTGTTGWSADFAEVKKMVKAADGSVLYAPNFSVGVLLFQRLAARAGELFAAFDSYDFALHEIHHTGKRDSPSGTAKALGETLLRALPGKSRLIFGNSEDRISPDALQISSTRVGAVPGTHRIHIDSEEDSIELVHIAHGRAGFARGAIKAAEWLVGRKGFFSFEEMLADIIAGWSN